ncbi:MAG TPA: T9SS type A sorting domain-containing protein, partial [Flavipsychrobacter sp.]
LSVYPMTTLYPRKVKITYLTPLKWHNDFATVELPTQIFNSSATQPNVHLVVKHNNEFSSPVFMEQDYNQSLITQTTGEDVLILTGSVYSGTSLNLKYATTPGIKLYTYAKNANEGVYQMVIPPASMGSDKNLNTVFVVDHPQTSNTIHTITEIKNMLRSSLLSNYNSTDSFNIFYVHNGAIVQAFPSWQQSNTGSVHVAINNIPSNLTSDKNQYQALLTAALNFCATKPGADAQVVILSNNSDYTTNQSAVDAMYTQLKNDVGGKFYNKIHIVNYSSYRGSMGGTLHNANDIWYNKLTLNSGGTLHKFTNAQYTYINGKQKYVYNLNMPAALEMVADNAGTTTSSYAITLGVNNGFAFSSYNLQPVDRLNMARHHIETGRYTGEMPVGTTVELQAIVAGQFMYMKDTLNTIYSGNDNYPSAWSYHFINTLVGQNNPTYAQEIIDSSIRNRVLCEYTAFLALETGDTIGTNSNSNPNWINVEKITKAERSLKLSPNPFSSNLTIDLPAGTELVEVFDMTGRKVFSRIVNENDKTLLWNGKDNSGSDLPHGVYMIVATTGTERYTAKVIKQ